MRLARTRVAINVKSFDSTISFIPPCKYYWFIDVVHPSTTNQHLIHFDTHFLLMLHISIKHLFNVSCALFPEHVILRFECLAKFLEWVSAFTLNPFRLLPILIPIRIYQITFLSLTSANSSNAASTLSCRMEPDVRSRSIFTTFFWVDLQLASYSSRIFNRLLSDI